MARPSSNVMYWGPFMPSGSGGNVPSPIAGMSPFPEDTESSDVANIQILVDKYFEDSYPSFEPQIVTRIDGGETKEYYLPALKVLKLFDGKLFSPSREVEWKNMECHAKCLNMQLPNFMWSDDEQIDDDHPVPNEECNCGIYGSVNLDEIMEYRLLEYQDPRVVYYRELVLGDYQRTSIPDAPKNVICVIEPAIDAKVIICRKGWRASHVFISEFVGETISVEHTSQLLSIAWCRNIDIRRIYENR